VYFKDKQDRGLPFICLFHQAGFSRGEYLEIAPRLVEMGYNCMAVDLRSGRGVNGVVNETARRAESAKKGTDYDHALPDIVASLQYAREHFAEGPLIAWGSSYSASLVLKASAENEGLVDGTLSFAPNDMAVWARDWLVDTAETVKHPVFFTSARREQSKWKRLREAYPEDQATAFIPKSSGRHGSRALWKEQSDSEAYWEAVQDFLTTNFPPTPTNSDEVADAAGTATRTSAAAAPIRPARPTGPQPEAAGGHGGGHGATGHGQGGGETGHGGGQGEGQAAGHGSGHGSGEEEPEGDGKPDGHG
jgi:dienelactone hydrolase